MISDDRESSNESQLLLSLIVSDLVTIIEFNIVEYPIAILILKSIILQCISYLQIDKSKGEEGGPKIELNHKLHLIDTLKEVMIPIQYILLQNESMNSQTCYCTVSIK